MPTDTKEQIQNHVPSTGLMPEVHKHRTATEGGPRQYIMPTLYDNILSHARVVGSPAKTKTHTCGGPGMPQYINAVLLVSMYV